MPHSELIEVANFFKYQYLKPGETLFCKGDQEDKMYIMLKGEAMVQVPDLFQKKIDHYHMEDSFFNNEHESGMSPKNELELTHSQIEALPEKDKRKH